MKTAFALLWLSIESASRVGAAGERSSGPGGRECRCLALEETGFERLVTLVRRFQILVEKARLSETTENNGLICLRFCLRN